MHSELFHGSRPVGRPYLRFKDTCKNALKCGHVFDLWKTVVDNRQGWRRLIRTVCESHDIKRIKEDESRRERRRQKKSRLLNFTVLYPLSFWVYRHYYYIYRYIMQGFAI